MKRVYAIESWCVNCRRCEVACKTFHSDSQDAVKAYNLQTPPPHNRIRVEGTNEISLAINCRHCEDPRCVKGCISGAMTKDPTTGIVTSDPDKCVGCRTCISMCPFGAVTIAQGPSKDIAFKCDLCGETLGTPGTPQCVEACPNRALIYVESEVA